MRNAGKPRREDGTFEMIPVLRLLSQPPPCGTCPKIPKDAPVKHWDHAVQLSDKNWRAYQYYLECRAVGQFPDDAIVRRNARIIRAIQDEADNRPLYNLLAVVGLLAKAGR